MKVALFASDEFAVPFTETLIEDGTLACLVTQPAKPAGRGQKVTMTRVGEIVLGAKLPVFTPESLESESFRKQLKSVNADIPVVMGYGSFIPLWIRKWSPYPCINVHPSLLPRWRGADPIRAAIIEGDKKIGITVHFTEKRMDAGDILAVFETKILPDETYGQLRNFLALAAVGLVKNFLARLREMSILAIAGIGEYPTKEKIGEIFKAKHQDESLATVAPRLEKEQWCIDWEKEAGVVHDHIRGLSPDPGARIGPSDKCLKILRTAVIGHAGGEPGQVIKANRDGLWIACLEGAISVISLQPCGKRIMNATDFINGYRTGVGKPLSSSL
jgi:methionyl-tRNA formyltransferase